MVVPLDERVRSRNIAVIDDILAELIREKDSSTGIVILTTSEEHRSAAFHCHASDYLIKPVTQESLFHTMDYLLQIKTETDAQRFYFTSSRRENSLPYAEIVHIRTESNGSNYLVITDRSGSTYRTRMTLSAVCDELDSRFLLLQSGLLVNMEHITALKEKCVTLDNGEEITYSTRKEIQQIWRNYMFDHIRSQLAIAILTTLLFFFPLRKFGSELMGSFHDRKVWYTASIVSVIFVLICSFLKPMKYETLYVNNVRRSYIVLILSTFILHLLLCLIFHFIIMGMLRTQKAEEQNKFY